jgi:hypothetical protein
MIDAGKAFDKIQHPFMIKSSADTSNRRSVPQHNRGYIWQVHTQHHTKWGKTETISSKVRNRQRYPLSPLLFNIVLNFLARVIRQEGEINGVKVS